MASTKTRTIGREAAGCIALIDYIDDKVFGDFFPLVEGNGIFRIYLTVPSKEMMWKVIFPGCRDIGLDYGLKVRGRSAGRFDPRKGAKDPHFRFRLDVKLSAAMRSCQQHQTVCSMLFRARSDASDESTFWSAQRQYLTKHFSQLSRKWRERNNVIDAEFEDYSYSYNAEEW